MAAINVTDPLDIKGEDYTIAQGARLVFRNSAGTPYVVVENTTNDEIEVWQGNATTPTAFGETDPGGGPSGTVWGSPSAAIDSTDIIHIVYMTDEGKSSSCRYVTFDADGSTDAFTGDAEIEADIGSDPGAITNLQTSVAVDSNDIPHISYTEYISDMGGDWFSIMYNNRIGGAWNGSSTLIEGGGSATNKNCINPDITVDADNLACISYVNDTDNDVTAAQADANDPSSFTLFDVATIITPDGDSRTAKPSIAVDSSGNHHVSSEDFLGSNSYELAIRSHDYGDAWGTWQDKEAVSSSYTEALGGEFSQTSLVINGTDRYIFFEDHNTGGGEGDDDIKYFTDSTGSWVGPTTLETGTFLNVKAKWAFWVDNDSTGTGRRDLYFYFNDSTPSDPNSYWANDAAGFDGDLTDFAQNSQVGASTVSTGYLEGTGTNAPGSGVTITSVDAHIFGETSSSGSNQTFARISSSGAEVLGTVDSPVADGTGWGAWVTLSAPSGGWDWTEVQGLVARAYSDIFGGLTFSKVEIRINGAESLNELDYAFEDGTDIWFNSLVFDVGGAATHADWPAMTSGKFWGPRYGS